jgi:small subunit ribosomal protein S9
MVSKKKKGIFSKAKKKEATARAVAKKGKGIVRINKRNLITIEPKYVQELLKEPLELAGPISQEVDINVRTYGGGFMSQMIAARGAIAKALLEYAHDEKLKKKFLAYDRMLLVDDARRVEPKKQLGPKARRKKQKSKR